MYSDFFHHIRPQEVTMYTFQNASTSSLRFLCNESKIKRKRIISTWQFDYRFGHVDSVSILFQSHFERLSATKLKKRKKLENIPTQNLIQRHAGVLGLCAYVEAYPYDVPEFMPQVLMDLSDHVNDPQPIQVHVIIFIYLINKLWSHNCQIFLMTNLA